MEAACLPAEVLPDVVALQTCEMGHWLEHTKNVACWLRVPAEA